MSNLETSATYSPRLGSDDLNVRARAASVSPHGARGCRARLPGRLGRHRGHRDSAFPEPKPPRPSASAHEGDRPAHA